MRLLDRKRTAASREYEGQAIVEFTIVSVVMLLMVIGILDLGRTIYLYSQLHNAVGETTREARTRTANDETCGAISQSLLLHRVRYIKNPDEGGACGQVEHERNGLQSATVTYSCSPACTSGSRLTVTASLPFQTIAQNFLGVDPFTMSATSSVTLE